VFGSNDTEIVSLTCCWPRRIRVPWKVRNTESSSVSKPDPKFSQFLRCCAGSLPVGDLPWFCVPGMTGSWQSGSVDVADLDLPELCLFPSVPEPVYRP